MTEIICIAGKNSIAVNSLKFLINKFNKEKLVFLPNEDDDGLNTWQPSFKNFAINNNIKEVCLEELYDMPNLVFISLEYAKIIKPRLFKSSELFNIHFSLLPKYKGMYTSALPIVNGDCFTGVTLHKIDSGIDTGDIIDQIKFAIEPSATARDVYFNYLAHAEILFKSNIDSIIRKSYMVTPQEPCNSSYFSKNCINYNQLKIDLNKTAYEIHNQFRAFTFREFQLPQFQDWGICKTSITQTRSSKKPGTVVNENAEMITIASIDFDLNLYKDYYKLLWDSSVIDNVETLEMAIRHVEDINLQNRRGWNAIILATYNGSYQAVKLLLSHKADLRSSNYNGTTLLMYAFSYYEKTKDSRIFKYLIKNGIDTSTRDAKDKSIKDYMLERDCIDLINLIS